MYKIKQLFDTAIKESFFSAVLKVASGTALAQLIGLAIIPIVTRLYSPEEFKLFALYAAVIALLGPISSLRYNVAIVIPKNIKRAEDLIFLSLLILFIFTGVILIFILLANSVHLDFLNQYNDLVGIAYLFPLGIFLSGLFLIFQNYFIRLRLFGLLAKISVFQALLSAVLQILLYKLKGAALIVGHMALSSGAFIFFYLWYKSGSKKVVEKHNIKAVMRRYQKYPKFSTFEVFFNSAGIQVPLILISFFVAGPEVSFLFLAMKIFQAPITLIGGSVSQVYLSYGVDKKRNNEIGTFTVETIEKLMKLGFIPIVVLAFSAPLVIPFILGAEWATVGYYVSIMFPWFLFQFLASPISMVMHVLGLQRNLMLLTAFGGILRIASVCLPFLLFEGKWLIELYILSGALFYAVCFFVFTRAATFQFNDYLEVIFANRTVLVVGSAIGFFLFFIDLYIKA